MKLANRRVGPRSRRPLGRAECHVLTSPLQALVAFYDAFNSADLDKMARVWPTDDDVVMANPVGGVNRGWEQIRATYARIFGLPAVELLAQVRTWGATILASATTVAEARWLDAQGVDVIIAQGLEAGGHRGMFLSDDLTTQIGTLALAPQIVQAVRRPVVAAGGIADARGVAAALALGAVGVQVGTAYLLCPEATTSAVHRAALRSEDAQHTAITNVFSGRPARGIVNRAIRELGPLSSVAPAFPLAAAALAPLRARAESQGSGDFSPLWAGQHVQSCKELPAGELTRELVAHT